MVRSSSVNSPISLNHNARPTTTCSFIEFSMKEVVGAKPALDNHVPDFHGLDRCPRELTPSTSEDSGTEGAAKRPGLSIAESAPTPSNMLDTSEYTFSTSFRFIVAGPSAGSTLGATGATSPEEEDRFQSRVPHASMPARIARDKATNPLEADRCGLPPCPDARWLMALVIRAESAPNDQFVSAHHLTCSITPVIREFFSEYS